MAISHNGRTAPHYLAGDPNSFKKPESQISRVNIARYRFKCMLFHVFMSWITKKNRFFPKKLKKSVIFPDLARCSLCPGNEGPVKLRPHWMTKCQQQTIWSKMKRATSSALNNSTILTSRPSSITPCTGSRRWWLRKISLHKPSSKPSTTFGSFGGVGALSPHGSIALPPTKWSTITGTRNTVR